MSFIKDVMNSVLGVNEFIDDPNGPFNWTGKIEFDQFGTFAQNHVLGNCEKQCNSSLPILSYRKQVQEVPFIKSGVQTSHEQNRRFLNDKYAVHGKPLLYAKYGKPQTHRVFGSDPEYELDSNASFIAQSNYRAVQRRRRAEQEALEEQRMREAHLQNLRLRQEYHEKKQEMIDMEAVEVEVQKRRERETGYQRLKQLENEYYEKAKLLDREYEEAERRMEKEMKLRERILLGKQTEREKTSELLNKEFEALRGENRKKDLVYGQLQEKVREMCAENRRRLEQLKKEIENDHEAHNKAYETINEHREKMKNSYDMFRADNTRKQFNTRMEFMLTRELSRLKSFVQDIKRHFERFVEALISYQCALRFGDESRLEVLELDREQQAFCKFLGRQARTLSDSINALEMIYRKFEWDFINEIKDAVDVTQNECEDLKKYISDFSSPDEQALKSEKALDKVNAHFTRLVKAYSNIPKLDLLRAKYDNCKNQENEQGSGPIITEVDDVDGVKDDFNVF